MVRRIGHYYSRRIVNVNVNIVLAGLLALIPTVGVVHLTRYMGFAEGEPELLTHRAKISIAAITFAADVVFDVSIYYALHWLANHRPRRWRKEGAEASPARPFLRDATTVQVQRMVISPLLYTLWLGGQYSLMKLGIGRELATVIGFVVGMTVARTVHTLWMLRSERAAVRRMVGARAG